MSGRQNSTPCWKKNEKLLFIGKKSKNVFRFFESWVRNNVSLFCLGQFGEVGAGLGSPGAGVEIGTG